MRGPQTKKRLRDPVNGLTHLVGGLLASAGLIVLLAKAASTGRVDQLMAFSIFGFSMVTLYAASALYHLLPLSPSGVAKLRRLDHVAIFLQGRLGDWLPREGVLSTVFPPDVTDSRAVSSLG